MDQLPDRDLLSPGFGPDALAEARRMIGQDIRIEQYNYEASRDGVRHYAWGLGDDNPLWSDPAYAAATRHGGLIAPPTFLYSVFDGMVGPLLPDIQWFYSGTDWEFFRPVRVGEPVTARARLVEAQELTGKRVKRMILQTGEITYHAADGAMVGRALSHTYRVPRATAEGGLSYAPRSQQRWSDSQLADIEQAMVGERCRGGEPRFWDDVNVGDTIPTLLRGPFNQMDMTCYYQGSPGSTGYKSTKLRFKYAHWAKHHPEKLPNNYDPSYYAAAICPSIGHQNEDVAQRELGMPGAYDNGPQRIGMMAVALTNWMGDDAELVTHSVRLHLPVIFGDLTLVKATVTGKRDAGSLVEVELRAENQLGELTATGMATIKLPRHR